MALNRSSINIIYGARMSGKTTELVKRYKADAGYTFFVSPTYAHLSRMKREHNISGITTFELREALTGIAKRPTLYIDDFEYIAEELPSIIFVKADIVATCTPLIVKKSEHPRFIDWLTTRSAGVTLERLEGNYRTTDNQNALQKQLNPVQYVNQILGEWIIRPNE